MTESSNSSHESALHGVRLETAESDNRHSQFGLLDVVEAFTAMRHEWRNQSKESRQFADSMRASTELLTRIESTLDQKMTAIIATDKSEVKGLIEILIDLDISVQRAVNATSNQGADTSTEHGGLTELRAELIESIRHSYASSGFFSRWISRTFYKDVIRSIKTAQNRAPDAATEGVRLILIRLRRMMTENNIDRVESVGKVFDAETMKAISTISSEQFEAGLVAQEITPAYFYKKKLLRYAEVRVSH